MAIPCPRTSAITRSAAASRPCTFRFKKGRPGNPRGPRPKNRPALLIEALDEPVTPTNGGAVDPSFAPPAVLRALPGMDEAAIGNLLHARASTTARPAIMLGHAFTITAEAVGPGDLRVTRKAIIRLTGRPNPPLWIYR